MLIWTNEVIGGSATHERSFLLECAQSRALDLGHRGRIASIVLWFYPEVVRRDQMARNLLEEREELIAATIAAETARTGSLPPRKR